jgi:Fic family protein
MEISNLLTEYQKLKTEEIIDHQKFNLISLDHHPTRIEGSTLTEIETQLLINEGLTPKGKPLEHSLMVTDHHAALLFTLESAKIKKQISTELIQSFNALVMRNTGNVYNTTLGTIDAKTGPFRRGNVTAGNSYFPNFDKVEEANK